MEVSEKPKIEALYPLTLHQHGLLFHHLSDAEDIGLLIVQCKLSGKLDFELLQEAWQKTVQQHEVLRSTVHWKKIEKPVILVRPEVAMNWERIDWSSFSIKEQEDKLSEFKRDCKQKGLQLDKNPLTNISLVDLGSNSYSLLWQCHHILLDGWSSNIILKDFMKFYDILSNDREVRLESIPSYKTYLNWLQKSANQEAVDFWKKTLEGFHEPLLFQARGGQLKKRLEVKKMVLAEADSEAIIALAKKNQITINSLFQGIWAILLSQYFDKEDVVFGTTVSGRSSGFPKIDLMTGMFTNVIPVRAQLAKDLAVFDCFKKIQFQQQLARNYEHFTVEELLEFNENVKGATLFDSLFVFENFPHDDIVSLDLKMSDFNSGVSSTYPMTLIIKIDDCITIDLIYDGNTIGNNIPNWLFENFKISFEEMLAYDDIKVFELRKELSNSVQPDTSGFEEKNISKKEEYVAPSTDTESKLTKLWEEIFDKENIGVNDNYFELGGKSLMAIKMFSLIEKRIGVKLAPTTLLFSSTIKEISLLITKNNEPSIENWKYIVPLRKTGHKRPLFCVHGGEGHVLFYKSLPKYLKDDRPVYLIQPKAIDGIGDMHSSIEEMSKDYLSEILQIEPDGPYNITFFCYSALAVEMASLLETMGKKANLIIVDSAAQLPMSEVEKGSSDRFKNYLRKVSSAPLMVLKSSLVYRYKRFIEPIYVKLTKDKTLANLAKIRRHLHEVHERYNWKKIDSKFTLILTKAEHMKLKDEKISAWRHWSNAEVKIHYNSGNHLNLFDEPHIKSLGETIETECI